jgi:nucleoside-diphosphate-sugar epimerase
MTISDKSEPDNELHVVFGAGPIGLAVVAELLARGKTVRVVNRSGRAAVPAGVEVTAGDATDPETTRQLCKGAAVVYNCTNPPYTHWPEMFPPLQAGVLAGAAAAGAKLVAMDNLYMYGPTNGRPLTEDLPYAATGRKGRVRAQMAEELLAAHRAGQVRVAIGRASDYFGPRGLTTAVGDRAIYPALNGKAAQIMGNPDLPHTYSYIPDIGTGLVTLGQHDEALGQVWHLPSPPTVTTRQLLEMVYNETGHPLKIQGMPRPLLKVLKLFNPMLRELDEMLYEFEEPFIVDHSKFSAAFKLEPTPWPAAIAATVDWFRRNDKMQ